MRMILDRFEKQIVTYLYDHGESRWSEIKRGVAKNLKGHGMCATVLGIRLQRLISAKMVEKKIKESVEKT